MNFKHYGLHFFGCSGLEVRVQFRLTLLTPVRVLS